MRRSQTPNCKLPTEHKLKKEKKGMSFEYVTIIDGIEVSSINVLFSCRDMLDNILSQKKEKNGGNMY